MNHPNKQEPKSTQHTRPKEISPALVSTPLVRSAAASPIQKIREQFPSSFDTTLNVRTIKKEEKQEKKKANQRRKSYRWHFTLTFTKIFDVRDAVCRYSISALVEKVVAMLKYIKGPRDPWSFYIESFSPTSSSIEDLVCALKGTESSDFSSSFFLSLLEIPIQTRNSCFYSFIHTE